MTMAATATAQAPVPQASVSPLPAPTPHRMSPAIDGGELDIAPLGKRRMGFEPRPEAFPGNARRRPPKMTAWGCPCSRNERSRLPAAFDVSPCNGCRPAAPDIGGAKRGAPMSPDLAIFPSSPEIIQHLDAGPVSIERLKPLDHPRSYTNLPTHRMPLPHISDSDRRREHAHSEVGHPGRAD
jgi:hypothetical protein